MPDKHPGREEVCLQFRWILGPDLSTLSYRVICLILQKMDLSHNREIQRNLSVLMNCDFTSLKTSILHDCDLSKIYRDSLVTGRLLSSENLDLSRNFDLTGCFGKLSSEGDNLKKQRIDQQRPEI